MGREWCEAFGYGDSEAQRRRLLHPPGLLRREILDRNEVKRGCEGAGRTRGPCGGSHRAGPQNAEADRGAAVVERQDTP